MSKPLTVLYTRISTSDKNQTVENQILAAEQAGWVIDKIYREEGVSGSVPPMKRPQFSAMMKDLPKGSKVVVSAQDRLSRSTKDLLIYLDELKDSGISLYILQLPSVDCLSNLGIMILSLHGSISAYELANLKFRVKLGLERAKKNGKILGTRLTVTTDTIKEVVDKLEKGDTILSVSLATGLSTKTIGKYKREFLGKPDALKEYKQKYEKQHLQIEAKASN